MAKNGLVAAMDNLPWIVKLILCIPALNVVWAIYRIIKGATQKDMLILIAGILWIVPGIFFGWILDLVTTIMYGKPSIFA